MALISKQKYDPAKIEKLAEYLRVYNEKGQPIDYEILIDGLKAVRRTNDPSMFEMLDNFITPDSKSIEVLFYNGNSNVNEKRIFILNDDETDKGLSGVEVENRIQEQLDRKEKEWQYNQLLKDNAELKQEVDELEKEVERLEKEKETTEANQSPLKGILGELGSSFVESFIRRNPKVMASIPGGEALAGLIEHEDKAKAFQEESTDSEVTFSSTSALSEEHKYAIQFVDQLIGQFAKDEFDKIILILEAMAGDKSKIEFILNQIKQ